MLLVTADCTAFQQQPEPLLTWKADGAVVFAEWEMWTRNEQETDYQVPSLVLEIVVNSWEQLQVQHSRLLAQELCRKACEIWIPRDRSRFPSWPCPLSPLQIYTDIYSCVLTLFLSIKTPCSSKQCCLFISVLIAEAWNDLFIEHLRDVGHGETNDRRHPGSCQWCPESPDQHGGAHGVCEARSALPGGKVRWMLWVQLNRVP